MSNFMHTQHQELVRPTAPKQAQGQKDRVISHAIGQSARRFATSHSRHTAREGIKTILVTTRVRRTLQSRVGVIASGRVLLEDVD